METIAHNNNELRKELSFWRSLNPKLSHLQTTRSLLEHYQYVLNSLLNTIQDIENSIVACKAGILHPSVISPHLLFQELSKLSVHYGNRFLNFENNNLLEIQTYIKTRCYIGTEEIIYFLEIPIVDPEIYTMYRLDSLPVIYENKIVSIIPPLKYYLKSGDKILPITQKCSFGHLLLCPNYLISLLPAECETEFILTGKTSKCKFVQLNTNSNYVKLMTEINRYLLFFPEGDTISVIQEEITETKTLFGTYLVSPGKGNIKYKNRTLFSPHNEFAGKPLIIGDIPKLSYSQRPVEEIILKDLNLDLTNLQHSKPIEYPNLVNFVKPSLWTMIMYLVVISSISYVAIKYYRHKRKLNRSEPQ